MRNDIERIRWLDEIKREALYYLEQGTDWFTVYAGPWTLTYDREESEVKE
jgi:hypothetical protein